MTRFISTKNVETTWVTHVSSQCDVIFISSWNWLWRIPSADLRRQQIIDKNSGQRVVNIFSSSVRYPAMGGVLPECHVLRPIESSFVNPDRMNPPKDSISLKAQGCSIWKLQEIKRRQLPQCSYAYEYSNTIQYNTETHIQSPCLQ